MSEHLGCSMSSTLSSSWDNYEYYLDYLDLMPVDEKKLRANKPPVSLQEAPPHRHNLPNVPELEPRRRASPDLSGSSQDPEEAKCVSWVPSASGDRYSYSDSIVIAFWVSLAAFVVLLFLILLYMSWSGALQVRNSAQHPSNCSWGRGLNLPLCIRRHLPHHRAPRETLQTPGSSVKEPGSTASGPHQQLQQNSLSTATPTAPQAPPAFLWELALGGDPHGIS